jgi:hypothetical protein
VISFRSILAEKVLADLAWEADSRPGLIYEQGGGPVIPPHHQTQQNHAKSII